jgi:hypothetical protein
MVTSGWMQMRSSTTITFEERIIDTARERISQEFVCGSRLEPTLSARCGGSAAWIRVPQRGAERRRWE